MNKESCPICGYTEITVLDESNCTTFEICESCGCESGYEYNEKSSEKRLEEIRREWVFTRKCEWWGSEKNKPKNWDPRQQMKLAGIAVPKQ